MPPQWQVGSFTKRSGTGTQSITGIPFLPDALMLWLSGAEDYGSVQQNADQTFGIRFSIGLTASPGDSWCGATVQAQNSSDEYSYTFARAFIILGYNIFGGTHIAKADVDSYDIITPGVNYGFTLDWTLNSDTRDRKIHYIAIGGLEAANVVRTGGIAQGGATVVTGVGFCPDLMLFVGNTNSVDEGVGNGSQLFFGVANHALEQWGVGIGGASGVTTNKARCQSTSHAVVLPSADTSTRRFQSAVTVVGADGFTLSDTGDTGASGFETGGAEAGVLCLKGIASVIGSFTKTDTVEVQTVTTPDLTPLGVLLASVQRASASGTVDHARLGIGAADLFGNQAAMAAQATDAIAVGTSHADCYATNTAAFAKYDNNTQTIEALAGLNTVGAGSFALGWDPCDAAATQMLFLAIGAGATATCDGEEEEEPLPTFHCVDDLTDADLISFRWDAGDPQIINRFVAEYDYNSETGLYEKMLIFSHDASVRKYGPRPEVHVQSQGLRTALGADAYLELRAREIFRRFGDAPPAVIQIEAFYRKNPWEVGDIICISSAFIPNLQISGRGIAEEPFEIVDLRPQFADRGRIVATLLDCEALSHDLPSLPVSGTDPGAAGPEDALTTLGLMGIGRGVWEIA